jgi:hypothetical protein
MIEPEGGEREGEKVRQKKVDFVGTFVIRSPISSKSASHRRHNRRV